MTKFVEVPLTMWMEVQDGESQETAHTDLQPQASRGVLVLAPHTMTTSQQTRLGRLS